MARAKKAKKYDDDRPLPGNVYPHDPYGRRACVSCQLPTDRVDDNGRPRHGKCEGRPDVEVPREALNQGKEAF